MKSFGAWFSEQGKPKGVDPDNEETWPDGLVYRTDKRQWEFECRRCERWTEWPVEPELFELGRYENLCGGTPHCCP